jgi:hypothetical protein
MFLDHLLEIQQVDVLIQAFAALSLTTQNLDVVRSYTLTDLECDGQFMYDSTVTPPSVTCEGTAVVSNCSYAAKETAGDICLICDDGYSVDPTDQSCIANTCLQEYNCLTCHSDGMKCLTCNAGTIQDPSSGQCYSEKELCEVGRPFFKKQYMETASGICAFEFGCDLTCDRKIQAVCEG